MLTNKPLSLYLAWLIPSSLSFISSLYILYYIIHQNKLRSQCYHQLILLLAITDLIQSGNWFIGPKYTATYQQCALQEYLLQAGTLYKSFTTLIICSIAMYIVRLNKHPPQKIVLQYTFMILLIPTMALILSILLHSARVFCTVDIKSYNEASHDGRVAILAFWLCFEVLVYLCTFIDIILLFSISKHLKESHSNLCGRNLGILSTASGKNTRDYQQTLFVNKLRIFPFIVAVLLIPDSVSLMVILLTGRGALTLRLIANACWGSTGWIISIGYFYFQYTHHSQMSKTVVVKRVLPVSSPVKSLDASATRSSATVVDTEDAKI
mmetsp:Transcript_11715/g.17750  ORF Transcript_11715/g.17750 Transcript_11715/m.17750 type:complete len:323 (+) Transcript_11715:38-1006(+)